MRRVGREDRSGHERGGVERRGQDEIGEEWKREHISIPVLMCLKVPVQKIVVHLQLVALFHALILSIRHHL